MNQQTVGPESKGTPNRKALKAHAQNFAGSSVYRQKYSRNKKKAFEYLIVSWVLGVLLLVMTIGWIVTGYKLSATKTQLLNIQISTREKLSDTKELSLKVTSLEKEVQYLQETLDSLVTDRIPNLHPLEFDLTLPSKQKYLKNISFTLTGTEKNKKYEYRAILRNDKRNDVPLDVNILLFDAVGIQVGMAALIPELTAAETGKRVLKPGETRAFSNEIELTRDAEPRYFLVEVK